MTVAFIGGVAAAGVYVGTKKTVISGKAMAATFLEKTSAGGMTSVDCPDQIPVTHEGAEWQCLFKHRDGSTANFKFTMSRKGEVKQELVDSTGSKHHAPSGDDPWKAEDD